MSNTRTKINFDDPSQVTGLTSAAGDLILGDTAGLTSLSVGTNGQVLTVSGGLPTWAAASGGSIDLLTREGSSFRVCPGSRSFVYDTDIIPGATSITTSVTVNSDNDTFTLPAPVGDVAIYNVKTITQVTASDITTTASDTVDSYSATSQSTSPSLDDVQLDFNVVVPINTSRDLTISIGSNANPVYNTEEKLVASDAAAGDNFGFAVSIDNDYVVSGAPFNDDVPTNSGSAYIYFRDQGGADNWGQVIKLTASDAAADDTFGRSVHIDGDNVIIGAPGKSTDTGAAYLFNRNEGGADNWGEVTKLTASDAATDDKFGWAVSISGDYIVVGASTEDGGGSNVGAAYIFFKDQGGTDNWGQVTKLTPGFADDDTEFGTSVDIDGDDVVIGAPFYSVGEGPDLGRVYLFNRNEGGTDNWGLVTSVVSSDAADGDAFGISVAISGDNVIAGASGDNSATGAAYIFNRDEGGTDNWGEVTKITASDAGSGDSFGTSVSISGTFAVASAPFNDDPVSNAGKGYLYGRDEGGTDNWGEVTTFTPSDIASNDDLTAISIDDCTQVMTGVPEKGSGDGAAYIFIPDTTTATSTLNIQRLY